MIRHSPSCGWSATHLEMKKFGAADRPLFYSSKCFFGVKFLPQRITHMVKGSDWCAAHFTVSSTTAIVLAMLNYWHKSNSFIHWVINMSHLTSSWLAIKGLDSNERLVVLHNVCFLCLWKNYRPWVYQKLMSQEDFSTIEMIYYRLFQPGKHCRR